MKKKLLALFLCCALSFGLVTAALITPAAADEDFLVYGSDGLVAHTVELAKNNKLALTAVASTGSGVYQWQIQVGGDVWANISGANGVTLDVSYALVANLLYGGAANLRCPSHRGRGREVHEHRHGADHGRNARLRSGAGSEGPHRHLRGRAVGEPDHHSPADRGRDPGSGRRPGG